MPTARAARARLVVSGLIVLLATALPLTAPPAQADSSHPTQHREVTPLDGFVIDHLPTPIGTPTDFDYEWEQVVFHSRVWETGPDPDGATRVDLTLKTIRAPHLTDLEALRTFLTTYHEKDPATWPLTRTPVGPYPGYTTEGHVFYLIAPGLAAEATTDHYTPTTLLTTATGFHPPTP